MPHHSDYSDFPGGSEPTPLQGKDEMNLADFPIASLRRRGDGRTSFSYEGWITDKTGQRHRQRWIVRGLMEVGLPTEYDERVIVALMAITAAQGFQARKVSFSVYQVLKIMGLTDSSRDYESVEQSLERLVGVTIFAEGSFWDNGERSWVKLKSGFHLIDKFWLAYLEEDEAVRTSEGTPGYFIWSEDIWKSIQDGYIKSLDLEFYYSLDSPLARRLYRFLDKRMHYQTRYEIDVFDLASRLGMARYDYPSKVIEKMQPALDELMARGFLSQVQSVKVKKYTRLRFERPDTPLPAQGEEPSAPVLPPTIQVLGEGLGEEPSLLQTLRTLGLGEDLIRTWEVRYDPSYLEEKLAYLRWELEVNQSSIRNAGGWLRRAVEENYDAPRGYAPPDPGVTADEPTSGSWDGAAGTPLSTPALLPQTAELWRVILQDLKGQVPPATYQVFLAQTRLLQVEAGQALIEVPSIEVQEWVEHRLGRLLVRTLAYHCGEDLQPVFVLRER